MKILGLIPARSGSKRVPGKNMALLNGKPLLQYAIDGAVKSKSFDEIVVSTDWDICKKLASANHVSVLSRPPELCQDSSHDYEWVKHAVDNFPGFDIFVILRPTSPFRTAKTIQRALKEFLADPICDSMRAVEKTTAHPKKSWELGSVFMYPYDDGQIKGIPWHDLSTQSLGDVYVQNGCIHIAWTGILEYGNYSGVDIKPFLTQGREGIDINTPEDLLYAEWLMGRKA
jgi:N-acylneuraminate cytidylyltransferase